MATVHDWLEGARLRTLPASLSPVIVGAGFAAAMGSFSWLLTLLAAGVALFFQIGVNFSNDYSDGIRGTDDERQGPPRLTGSEKVAPKAVLLAAIISYLLGCACGLALVWLSGHWWLLAVGAAAVLAGWFYTGGKRPYGYAGLGELFVLIFFGYVATMGTVYTQTHLAPLSAWLLATGVGLIACALLMINNIRDIPSDTEAGKKTLAVRLGQTKARWSYYFMLAIAVILATSLSLWNIRVLTAMLAMLVWVVYMARPVISGAEGDELLKPLRNTALFELVYAILVAAGLVLNVSFPGFYWSIIGWGVTIAAWLIWLVIEMALFAKNSRKNKTALAQESSELSESAEELADSSEEPAGSADDTELASVDDEVTETATDETADSVDEVTEVVDERTDESTGQLADEHAENIGEESTGEPAEEDSSLNEEDNSEESR